MAGDKRPPIKLVWFEAVTDWLAGIDEDGNHGPRPNLSVTRSAMNQVVAMVLRATRSKTNEAIVAGRWVESMTGVNRGVALKALSDLESYGWLRWTQRRQNRVKVYEITRPQVVTHSHHLRPSGDTSGDSSGDSFSPTPGTPGTPLEDLQREGEAWRLCENCEEPHDAHDADCPHRPFPPTLEETGS